MKIRSILALVVCSCWVTPTAFADHIDPSEFSVAEGFEVTVWATTPQLYNPTNFDIDAKGRMWVTEAVNYRNFRNEELGISESAGDRVVVLEDLDGDGTADSSHTFVRDPDLVAPLGIGVIDNKVIVSCAPNILIYTDVDRDARFDPAVDTKEVFLTGFRGLDHDHSLHSVKIGPDGYWYFNVGNAGAHTVTDKAGWTLRAGSSYAGGSPHLKDNTPGRKSDDGRVWVGGVGLRIRPDGTGLEPLAHNFRNVYEETLSSFGDIFHADNDDPPACRTTWVMENGNAGFASADGSRPWRLDQRPGQPVRVAEWRQEDPGTMPAGDVYGYGAPTGIVYGENGCFDSNYPDGLLLSCESARGEVFGYVPRPQGAGFTLERFDFLKVKTGSPKHGWFRPSDVAIGADGAIYVTDWYDPGVGGHRMADKTGSGTVYRIAPSGFKPKISAHDLSTVSGQIAALKSPAVNVRGLAFEALKATAGKAESELTELVGDENSFLAARAIWLLPFVGESGRAQLNELLNHIDPQIKITAFRAIRRASAEPKSDEALGEFLQRAQLKLCNDSSSAVRREVALSLRDIRFAECRAMIETIAAGFDGWDRWYLEALGTACDGKEDEAYDLLVGASKVESIKWDRRTAAIAWRLHPSSAVNAFAERAMSAELPMDERKRMMTALAFIPDRKAADSMLELATQGPEDLRETATWWGHSRDSNAWKDYDLADKFPPKPEPVSKKNQRVPDLDFVLDRDPVFDQTGTNLDVDVDIKGARRLYLFADSEIDFLDAKWVSPIVDGSDGSENLAKMEWETSFGAAVGIPVSGVKKPWRRPTPLTQPSAVHPTESSSHIAVTTRSVVAFDLRGEDFSRFKCSTEVVSNTDQTESADDESGQKVRFRVYVDRSPIVEETTPVAELEALSANAAHGRALFFFERLKCGTCHIANSMGGEVGPDLTSIGKKHATSVLYEAILKPSAAISMGFETTMVLTLDGEVISGLLVSAGDPVVVKDADGKFHSVAREDLDEMKSGKKSIMPELKDQLTVEETAALVAFLKNVKGK